MYMFLLFLLVLAPGVRSDTVGDGSDSQPGVFYVNPNNFTAGGLFERNLNTVLDFLVMINASETYRYGSGEDEAFGYRRCFFQTTCSTCIQQIRNIFKSRFPRATGARYWMNESESNSCYLHYEKNSLFFVNISPPDTPESPSNSPDSKSNTEPPLTSTERSSKTSKTGIYVGVCVGVTALVVLGVVGTYFFCRRPREVFLHHSRRYTRDLKVQSNETTVFGYETLRAATGDFGKVNELGHGGFGTVYKGVLEDGTLVAVKKLSLQSHQGRREFVNEISIITGIQHKNLVRLKGYCIENDQRLLVYEFMENGSLDKMLFGDGLLWRTRHAIMRGVARGLTYLHEDSHVQIIHRDIKASNILLDKELNAKISDFGVSKLFDHVQGRSTSSTRVAGTLGYMAPEYATRGRLTPKADVFSFGVLLLEMISGRRCNVETLPPNEQLLLEWVWKLQMQDSDGSGVEEVVDRRLLRDETYSSDEANRAILIALLCTQGEEGSRPTMSNVVAMFQGLMALPPLPSEPPSYLVVFDSSEMRTGSFVTAKTS